MSISFYIWAIDSLNMPLIKWWARFFRDLEWTQLRAMPPWAAPSDLPWRGLRELRLIRNGISILLGTSGQNLGFHANGKCPISQVVQNVMKLPDASGKKNISTTHEKNQVVGVEISHLLQIAAHWRHTPKHNSGIAVQVGKTQQDTIPKTSFASLWTCKCPVMTLMKSDIWSRGIPKNNHN